MLDLIQRLKNALAAKEYAKIIQEIAPALVNEAADGKIVELPCKVGDTVYVIAKCEEIMMHQDNDYLTGTGAVECPFENDCDFEDCDDENIQILETECGGFALDAGQWFVWFANITRDILVSDFGKTVFLSREAAENALKERET